MTVDGPVSTMSSDTDFSLPRLSPVWATGVLDEARAYCTGFINTPKRPYHWLW